MASDETGGDQAVEQNVAAQATEAGQGSAEQGNAEQGNAEQGNAESVSAAAVPDRPFGPEEISQFAADDVGAGGAIGKMLAIMFIYTVIVMAYIGWATWAKAWPLY